MNQDEKEVVSEETIKEQIQTILDSLSSKLIVENGKASKANSFPQDKENAETVNDAQDINVENSIFKQGVEAFRKIGSYYSEVDNGECMEERSRYISRIEDALSFVSAILAEYLLQIYARCANEEDIWAIMKEIETDLEGSPLENSRNENTPQSFARLKRFVFVHELMPALGDAIHDYLLEKHSPFTELFQKYGNSIRCYGKIWCETPQEKMKANDIFSIPRRIV